MTEKLYDISSKIKDFECTVLRCELSGGEYLIETDRTAFFPESGGQCGDTGKIGDAVIIDTRYDGERIVHISHSPIRRAEAIEPRSISPRAIAECRITRASTSSPP